MTSIAQLIKASDYACTGMYPVQARAMFLNEFSNHHLLADRVASDHGLMLKPVHWQIILNSVDKSKLNIGSGIGIQLSSSNEV